MTHGTPPGAYGREPPYWEAAELLRFTPQTPDTDLSNYVHHYEQPGYPGQLLSTQMREGSLWTPKRWSCRFCRWGAPTASISVRRSMFSAFPPSAAAR